MSNSPTVSKASQKAATSDFLLARNVVTGEQAPSALAEPKRFSFDNPLGRFDIPKAYSKATPWHVSAYWQRCLIETGRWPVDWQMKMGLRPAQRLLKEHSHEMILRAIRFWSGELQKGRAFSLWWLNANMDEFYGRLQETWANDTN